MSELLNCPFCGSPAQMNETEGDDRIIHCTNDKCGAFLHDDMHWDGNDYCAEENVTGKWNTRAEAQSLQEVILTLKQNAIKMGFDQQKEISTLTQRLAEVEVNFKLYGEHRNDPYFFCAILRHSNHACDCGFEQALSNSEEQSDDS